MTAAETKCEACGHPQRASRREVEWTHSFNLHDEIRALEERNRDLALLLAEAVERLRDEGLDASTCKVIGRAERALEGGT